MSAEEPNRRLSKHRRRETAGDLFDLGFLPEPAPQICPDRPGDLLARYRLSAMLGEGGFGVVWAATQTEPIEREVALKLIKRGMDSCEIIARFEAERQALARMDHPNIAAVLDAGTTADGRPFFVMELVRGEPLSSYCDVRKLSIRERLDLFIPVCLAVQHAHQKAILHRDLKPTNILVAEIDRQAVPKVIDFGIAKALGTTNESALQASLLQTRAGAVIGTLQYMSPEQAGSVPDVDTRSDIYSLGVLLYELLTGETPLSGQPAGHIQQADMLRRIREEEVVRPSTRISAKGAERRGSDPVRLRRQIRGDLDWITLKALEKDRRRRYDNAGALAADLRRFLNDEPVTAVAPTWSYQAGKLVRRHRLALTVASVVFVALTSAATVSLWQAAEARKASVLAEARRVEAEEDSRRARDAVEVYLSRVTDDPKLRDEAFRSLRKNLLESALPFYEQMGRTKGNDPAFRADQAWALGRLGVIYREAGEREKGIAPIRQAIELMEQLVAEAPRNETYRRSLGMHCNSLCVMLRESGKEEEAIAIQKRALAVAEDLARDVPENEDYQKELSILFVNFGQALGAHSKVEEGEAALKKALQVRQTLADRNPRSLEYLDSVASAYADLGRLLYTAGKPTQGEPYYRQALMIQDKLATDPDCTPKILRNLANNCSNFSCLLHQFNSPEKAIAYIRRSIELNRKMAEQSPLDIAGRNALGTGYLILAEILLSSGKNDDAEGAFRTGLQVFRALASEFPDNYDHVHLAGRMADQLGNLRQKAGDDLTAREFYKESLTLHRNAFTARPRNRDFQNAYGKALANVGETSLKTGDYKNALALASEFPRAHPADWTSHEKSAGWIECAIPMMAGDENVTLEKRTESIDLATARGVDLLKRSLELGNPSDYADLSERFPNLRANPTFSSLKALTWDTVDRTPSRFTFDFQDDDPGKRLWTRDGDMWLEVKPSGKTSHFKVLRRVRANGVPGTEIEKIEDAGRYFFIPDKGPAPSYLLMKTSDGNWATIGKLADIE